MKFKHGTRRRALEYEKDWVQRWKEDGTFEKSVDNRPADNAYVFYDGPPFITGVPHHGTLLSSIVKDAVPRYWTMKGRRVERVWGWDTHGLPAENFVEKQLSIVDRRQIVKSADEPAPLDKDGNELPKITLEEYITKARESMVANAATWEDVVDRVGRWVDFKGAYRTMDKDFMESVWWAFKELYDKGKIYEGEKVLMYDTRFATPVSKNEVTMDNDAYQTVTDPSVYVKFKLKEPLTNDTKPTYMLAWTTTPWTLPANTALAVNKDHTYQLVEYEGENFIIDATFGVSSRVFTVGDTPEPAFIKILDDAIAGKDLVGLEYEPLLGKHRGNNAHKIWHADYVSSDNGSGIVHLAPIYGEEDFSLAMEKNIPRVHVLDDNGYYYPEEAETLYTLIPWIDATKPIEVWENNKNIAKGLEKAGIVLKIDYIRHEYPFNPRSKQRIMYRAIPSWFFDVQGSKPLMLEQNDNINWFPEHLKHGRFAKNIEQAPDWNLSRDRFWATAMPVWKGDKGTIKVIGSYAELKELSGVELEDYHRPWVDGIEFDANVLVDSAGGHTVMSDSEYNDWSDKLAGTRSTSWHLSHKEHFTRIDKVLDCWFESGSMPFAQFHYPFENKQKFEANFPGDFIVEYVGQVRAWFYYVHVVNTALFGTEAFKNVITTGVVAGNDGRKMSKSLGNFTDPNELMDKYSADSLRFLLLSSPLLNGEDFALQDKDVGDVARKLSMVWNMYDFFTMYAEVDGWEYDGRLEDPLEELSNPLDIWIVSRLHQLVAEVEEHMDGYDLPGAMSPILPFLDDASNWYVRRSRRRFWKSEDDGDKAMAYRTLHYVLVRLAYVLAPFTPFLAEELYHSLTGDSESIHLKDWLPAGRVNQLEVNRMQVVRELINEGLSQRAAAGTKVRQPLGGMVELGLPASFDAGLDSNNPDYNNVVDYKMMLMQELNLKCMFRLQTVADGEHSIRLDMTITPELRREGLMREIIRHVQAARKAAGLNVDDRITLSLATHEGDDASELRQAIDEHLQTIGEETLAEEFSDIDDGYEAVVKVEGHDLRIKLAKV